MSHTAQGFKDFQHLPFDIHALILSFLHPQDIIAIRKTCKTMFDATLQRDLWMKAVVNMCEENTVHASSFPVADMSLLDLEYASMGATRWKKLVTDTANAGNSPLPPSRVRRLGDNNITSAQLYLIPGGRFLLLLNEGRLSIWDLFDTHETSGSADIDRQPIASVDTECGSFTAHPTPDGSGLLIITVTYSHIMTVGADIRYGYEVFKIFPGQRNPQLVSIARISIPSQYYLDFTSVVGNRLVLLNGPLVKIWDFETNAWASWNASEESFQILMDENTIALIREPEREVWVWDFPELSASTDAQEEFNKLPESGLSTHLPPRSIVSFPPEYNPDPGFRLGCGGLCDWYTGSRQPLMFDLWEQRAEAGHFEFTRFHVVDLQGPKRRLEVTSASPTQLTLRNSNARPSFAAYRACGDDTVLAWSDHHNLYCHTGGLCSLSRVNSATTLLDVKDIATREFSLCPIAGRLCYVDPETYDIRVVDFFPPPPKPKSQQI